jgi:TPR repeat protein
MYKATAVLLSLSILLTPAMAQGRPPSMDQQMYQHGRALFNQKKYVEARPLLAKACASGKWDACDMLTIMYVVGLGGLPARSSMVGPPFLNAVPVFERACAGGDAVACSHLGYMYDNGIGVPMNFDQKMAFYLKGCDGGDAFACDDLGIEHDVKCQVVVSAVGGGTAWETKSASDCPIAVSLYAKSCDLGFAKGCQHLGSMYHRGAGVAQDDVRAEALFRKACSAGAAGACRELENMRRAR